MTTLCIFHRSDFDGLCSHQIALRYFGDRATYLGFEYGDPIPDLSAYDQVYLMDISLPKETMEQFKDKLIWLDHHKSAIESCPSTINGIRIDGVAACRITWQWFFGSHSAVKQDYVERRVVEPYAVQLLGEYDIWDKRNPDTDLFQVGLSSIKQPQWEILLTENSRPYLQTMIDRGQTIADYLDVVNRQISNERGFDLLFEGLSFRVLNTARSNSITFKDSLKPHHDGCMSYFWNGRKWNFSFYGVPGKPDVDLSKVAIKYGGGGHKQACGCSMDVLPKELGGQ